MADDMKDLIVKMYAEMQKGFQQVNSDMQKGFDQVYSDMGQGFSDVNNRIDNVENKVKDIKRTVLKMEHEHGEKLSALFDGYKQNSDKLDRIEIEVSKHEEIILRRVR